MHVELHNTVDTVDVARIHMLINNDRFEPEKTQGIWVPGRRKALMRAIMPAFLLFLMFIKGTKKNLEATIVSLVFHCLTSAGNYSNNFAADLLYY